jgi:hypothetical protein
MIALENASRHWEKEANVDAGIARPESDDRIRTEATP